MAWPRLSIAVMPDTPMQLLARGRRRQMATEWFTDLETQLQLS
jgi:hypothetical protein